jgi:hypothetical protein
MCFDFHVLLFVLKDANKAFLREFEKYFTTKRIPIGKLHSEYSNDLIQIIQAKLRRLKK